MSEDRHLWQAWANYLHRWGVHEITAALLEAAGPLNMVLAQVVYLGQPLVDQVIPRNSLEGLARLLEDSRETQAFVSYLREASPHGCA